MNAQRKMFGNLVQVLMMLCMALALAACGGEEGDRADSEAALSRTQAPGGTGGILIGGSLGYDCNGDVCTCSGDDDCNDMFDSGECASFWCSECDQSAPVVSCWCDQVCDITWGS